MNVKSPLLVNGQLNMKKELWKFRNKTIRAFIKEENTEKKQMILSTRKSKFVFVLKSLFILFVLLQIG